MSPVLPFDILALIIDIAGENKETDLLKELALVSHSFHQISSRHLFATVELDNGVLPNYHNASSKKGFVKLLKSRPDVVQYIRKLKYYVGHDNDEGHQLPPILLNFIPAFSRLSSLTITARDSYPDWNTLDSSLKSAFLQLMHLPTINHIDLSFIHNFSPSNLTPSVNLLRLDISLCLSSPFEEDGSPEIMVEMMPKIHEFRTSDSFRLTTKLLHAKRPDGQPAFNFMDLRRFSTSFKRFEDERNIRYLLQNAKLLEELHLEVAYGRSLVGFLFPNARTLKVLDLTVPLNNETNSVFLGGFCEELEALVGHNMLETLSFTVRVFALEEEDFVGSKIQKVEKVLVKPGWSKLKQVSFRVSTGRFGGARTLSKALRSLPDKYLSQLSKLESVAFDYSVGLFGY